MGVRAEGKPGGILIVALAPFDGEPGIFRSPTGENVRKWSRDILGDKAPVMFDYIVQEPIDKALLFERGFPTALLTKSVNHLKSQIKSVYHPKIVVIMGDEATRALLHEDEFQKIFNYVYDREGIKYIPTMGVRELNIPTVIDSEDDAWFMQERKFYRSQFWFKAALYKALNLYQGRREPAEVYLTNHDPVVIDSFLHELLTKKQMCVDLETKGKEDHRLTAIGLGFDNHRALSVSPSSPKWDDVKAVLKKQMEDESVLKINQNLMGFDAPILWYDEGIDLKGRVWDTLHIFNYIYPELPHGLRDQGRLYLYRDPWKGFHSTEGERLRIYNAEDVVATMRCYEAQREELKAWGQLSHVVEHIVDKERDAWQIMTRGIRFSVDKQQDYLKQVAPIRKDILANLVDFAQPFLSAKAVKKDKRDPAKDIPTDIVAPAGLKKRGEVEAFLDTQGIKKSDVKEYYLATKTDQTRYGLNPGRIYKKSYNEEITMTAQSFNPRSPVQLKNVFDNLKIKLPKAKKSSKEWGPSTNKKAIMTMLRDVKRNLKPEEREFLSGLLRFRNVDKFTSTYLNAKVDTDLRWRCRFNINGTATGRASSSQSIKKTGGNNQNIPREGFEGLKFKSCFIADEGQVLYQFDQATAEMVIVAYLARCDKMIRMLENNEDVHVYFISQALGEDVASYKASDPAKYKRLRQLGKGGNFCITGDHEVLTPTGWVRVDEWDGQSIMIVNPAQIRMHFEKPLDYIVNNSYKGPLKFIDSTALKTCATPNHSLFVSPGYNRPLVKKEIQNLNKSDRVLLNAKYDQGGADVDLRRVAAIQADGHIRKHRTIQFNLTKARKIERLRMLFPGVGECRDGRQFYVKSSEWTSVADYLTDTKQFKLAAILKTSFSSRKAFIEEVVKWDGWEPSNKPFKKYMTTSYHNAQVVMTVAASVGVQAILNKEYPRKDHPYAKYKCLYRVSFNSRKYGRVSSMKINDIPNQPTYCFTTTTGAFLTRYQERIHVTGNSGSYGTGAKTLADMFMLQGVDVTVQEAQFILDKRREVFPEVYEIFQGDVIAQLHRDRTLVTPFGRKRKFYSILDENTYREAFAFIPQSTVPYISNHMIRLIQKDRPFGAEVLQQGHDAVMGQLPIGNKESFKKWFFEEAAKLKLTIHDMQFAMKWAGGFGQNWGEIE